MTPRFLMRSLVLALAVLGTVPAAFAGGPLYVYDPATRTPYTWPGGRPNVYTDLGSLGILSNEEADAVVAFSWNQWNQVPTSSFEATMAGDFASIGLPDIDVSNIDQVLGAWNGGGIHIVYDADGAIFDALFGPYSGVLGFALVEWVDEDSPAILEGVSVLNGAAIPDWMPREEATAELSGITTHEFGHAANLAHSQTNGQLVFFFDVDFNTFEPNTGAAGCPAPYAGFPDPSQVETMYPFIAIGGTGAAAGTVESLEDRAAISDLYPAAGWPAAYPSIKGTIYAPDGRTQFTGANVIARNIADPFGDAVSGLSGNATQGMAGPDGRYTFNGLTPGAQYAVYLDGIVAGAFSTPVHTVLPGPEEFYNAAESNDGLVDPRCDVTPIAGVAGMPRVVDLKFNRIQGGPQLVPVEKPASATTGISGDGGVIVGVSGYGVWRWTPAGGFQDIGGSPRSITPSVSENGRNITGELDLLDEGVQVGAVWQGKRSWMPLGGLPGSVPCADGYWSSAWGVSDNRKVVGLAWDGCVATHAYSWDQRTGMASLGFLGDSSRANAVTADGATVVGWDRDPNTGFWRGARWSKDKETLFQQPPALCCNLEDPWCPGAFTDVGSAEAISASGSVVVGESYQIERLFVDPETGQEYRYCTSQGWKWTPSTGVRPLGEYYGKRAVPTDTSNDGNILSGIAWPDDFFSSPSAFLWTTWTGFLDVTSFLNAQGTYAPDWLLGGAGRLAGDGRTIGGWAATPFGYQGWFVRIPKLVICHSNPVKREDMKTLVVDFPAALPDHMAHGDTIGICGNGVY